MKLVAVPVTVPDNRPAAEKVKLLVKLAGVTSDHTHPDAQLEVAELLTTDPMTAADVLGHVMDGAADTVNGQFLLAVCPAPSVTLSEYVNDPDDDGVTVTDPGDVAEVTDKAFKNPVADVVVKVNDGAPVAPN